MFFLIRCAFWIALVFLVVPMVTGPRSGTSPPSQAPSAGATDLPSAGEATAGTALGALVQEVLATAAPTAATPIATGPDIAVLSDFVRFCGENGDICAAGFSAIETLGTAIGDGLSLIASLTADDPAAPADDGTRVVATTSIVAAGSPAAGTLTPDDVAEPWRGTAAVVVAGSQARLRLPPPAPRRPPQG